MNAAELILKKALVASNLDSKEWNQVQAAFRNRAFFSSQVAQANVVQAMRQRVAEYAERGVDISEARKLMRADLERAHYQPDPGKEGTIKDLFSKARLDTILKHNLRQARGMIQRASGMSPGAFAAFPAQEFKRTHHRKAQRQDWPERWRKAGGKVYGGRMIALKTDPVWERLSVFGNPFPPFDWGSGMGVVDVDRKTAIELGLVTDEKLREETAALRNAKPEAAKFNDNLQATVSDKNGNELGKMRTLFGEEFGDLVKTEKVGDDVVLMWRPEILQKTLFTDNFTVKLGTPQENGMLKKLSEIKSCSLFAEQIRGKQLTINQTWRDAKRPDGSNHLSHFFPEPNNPNNIPLAAEEVEMLPTLWRNPDRIRKLQRDLFEAQLDAFDGSVFVAQFKINATKGGFSPQLWTFYKKKSPKLL